MKNVVGIVSKLSGIFFAKDEKGNIKELKVGDKIYEGEIVFGKGNQDSVIIESPQTHEKIVLHGTNIYFAQEYGFSLKASTIIDSAEALHDDINAKEYKTLNDLSQTHKAHATTVISHESVQLTSYQTATKESVGFQEVFLARDGDVVNVIASLNDAEMSSSDIDIDTVSDGDEVMTFNPPPELTTQVGEVQDNFYDTYQPSGTNTVEGHFALKAPTGLRSITIGDREFTVHEIESFGSSPVTLRMSAGTITFHGYSKSGNEIIISYTYVTTGNFLHEKGSDLFTDALQIIVTDLGNQTANGTLRINVVDDRPITESDSNEIEVGRLIDSVTGNVFANDHIGADDETSAAPVVGIVSSFDPDADGSTNVGKSLTGKYGSIVLNEDGTYEYTLDETNPAVASLAEGDTLTESFTYIIEDGDKDRSTNTLTITIDGTSSPVVNVEEGTVDDNYYDTYLPSGTNEVNDYINFSMGGDIKSVKIGDKSFTQSDLEALNTTPVTISMEAGDLTLNSFTQTGDRYKIGFTYITSGNYLHDANSDNFVDTIHVTVSDGAGREAQTNLKINVIDDKPIANDDTNRIKEGDPQEAAIHGNVLENDHVGADDDGVANDVSAVAGGTIGTQFYGKYGYLTLQADGSYTYKVDNTNITVKSLQDGETLEDDFVYTIEDMDGDTRDATLKITIEGNTSSPVLFVVSGNAYESSLDTIGTDASDTKNIFDGAIYSEVGDGFKDVVFESGGHTLTLDQSDLNAIENGTTYSMQTKYGDIVFNGFEMVPHAVLPGVKIGKLSYTYTLTSAVDHTVEHTDNINITITDVRGNTAIGDLEVNIVDDTPIATDNLNVVTEDSADVTQVSGNVFSDDDGSGVDVQGADQDATKVVAETVKGAYGTVVFNSDGSYTYTLDNDNPLVDALNDNDTLTDTVQYTLIDEDGSTDTANLSVTINGTTDPNLSVADVTVVEDGENNGNMQVTFTISMDATSSRDVTFDYTTIEGSALENKEYTPIAGSATIPAGSTSTTVTVHLGADDYVADSAKQFDLKITNVNSAGAILDATGTATINDDAQADTPYDHTDTIENSQENVTLKLVATDADGNPLADPTTNSATEGGKAYYKVLVQDGNGKDVFDADGKPASGTVNIVYTDDTATGGTDYDNTTVTSVEVNRVFSVDILDDYISDDGEKFQVSIADDESYSKAHDYENVIHDTTPVTTTINDDVDVTTLSLSGDATVAEGDSATYTLTIDQAPQTDLDVTVALTNVDTADDDFDFGTNAKTQTVTIAAGTTSSTFTIDTVDDSVYEGSENYKVSITGFSGGGMERIDLGTSEVTTTITDNDAPHIRVDDVTIKEDGTASITVTSDIEAKEDMVFDYTLSADTATAGVDFTPKTGTVTIAAGDTTATIDLDTPIDDYFADDLEKYNVTLSTSDGVIVFDDNVSSVTIDDNTGGTNDENNEDPVTLKLVAVDNAGVELGQANSANEGGALFYKVKLVDKDGNDVLDSDGNLASGTVDITYTDDTATGGDGTNDGDDYINTLTTVNINEVFSAATLKDSVSDDNETFDVAISGNYENAADYETVVYDGTKVTSTINDDTSAKDIVYLDVSQDATVDEADGALLTHTLTFKKANGDEIALGDGKRVTVTLNYTDDATEAEDFQDKKTTVELVGDGTTSSFSFSNIVADDFLKEGSESYTLKIESVTDVDGYFEALLPLGFGKATGTINDETTPDEVFVSIHSDQTIIEGDLSGAFTVAIDRPGNEVTSDITVALTYSGTAVDGSDFKGVAQVTIPAGSNATTFDIATIQDKDIEGSEDFTITIGAITDTNFEKISADPNADSVTNTIIDNVDANADTNALKEGGNQVTGNLLSNDEVGTNGQISSFKYIDETGAQKDGALGVEADTQYGRITVQADGSYVYYSDLRENHPSDGDTDSAVLKDIIDYTVTDDNEDFDSSTLTVSVGDTIGSVVDGPASSVDEDDLSNGSDTTKESLITANNDLGIQASKDGVESVGFNLTEVQAALDLKSHGVALEYSLGGDDNNILTAKAGEKEVFVVTLNKNSGADASYDFELKAPIDHLNSSGGKLDSLNIAIPFFYKEIGSTEDTVRGNLTVNVVDDTPTAVVDAEETVVEGSATPITGNVLTNDIQGADGALLLDFKYKDTTGTLQDKYFSQSVTSHTVDTPTGSLTVNRDGSWSFTPHAYVDHDDAIQGDTSAGDGTDNDSTQGSFEYRLQDYDTDNSDYVKQVIHVTDGADPSASDVTNAVDEDDIAGSGSDQSQSATVSGNLVVTGGSDPIDVGFTTTGSGTFTSNGVAIDYTLSNNGHTLTGTAGSKVIFVAQVTGDATVNNPTYTFELKGAIDHPDADGENTLELPLEFKALDIDGDAATGNLTVTITDDIPSVGTPEDGTVDESGLPFGATPDVDLTVTSGSLAVAQEADAIDTVFDANTISSLEAQNIQATVGNALSYAISNNGHTLTASYDGKDYFSVDINNPTNTTASYKFTLINAIYEPTSGGTQNINIPFTVKDCDKDIASGSFNVLVQDDRGSTDKQLTVDEDGSITFGVTSDDIDEQDDVTTTHGVISFDDATNLFTYTPNADYSGVDNGIVLDYVVNGVSHSVNIDATINPVSDAPILSEDASAVETDEDVAVALGFNRPVVKDDTDQNNSDTAPNSSDGDNPERLSAISLSGLSEGAKLLDGDGSVLWESDGGAVTIVLSDLDENHDGEIDHVYGASGDLTMTVEQFEALKVLPPQNSGKNLSVTMEVTSYEVDDAGEKLAEVAGVKSSQTVDIDVHAKTDDGIAISVADIEGNEDEWMRIDHNISVTKTADTDGSEVYELVFDGTNLPDGTLYYTGATPADMSDRSIGHDASGGFSVTIADIDNLPEIYLMTPVNDSRDITDLKVTLNVHDTDSDSTPTTDVVKSVSDFIDVTVTPVANDITVASTGAEGDEDTKIPLNLSFTNEDGATSTPAGLEKVTSVTISNIPDDAKLFDENGLEVDVTNGSVTVEITGGDTSKIEQYTIQPPAHSSKDITLQVSMTIKDEDDNDGALHTDTSTTDPVDVVVKVDPVSETDSSDTAAPSGDDITPVAAHTYTAMAEEDTFFDLNNADAGYRLEAANEDALVNEDGTTNPYGSEETFVVFTNARYFDGSDEITVAGDTFIKYNDGVKDVNLKFSGTGEVRVPLEFLDTVEIKTAKDFSGTFKVDTYVQNQDLGEDPTDAPGNIETSSISTLVINVKPVPEVNPSISINNISGLEDAGRYANGTIDALSAANGIALNGVLKTSDSDGSETFTVTIDAIPEDAALYVKGHIVYANSGSDFSADGITSSDNGDGSFKVTIQELDPVTPPYLIPPHNSNENITLQISGQIVDTATLEDGTVITVSGPESAPVPIDVVLTGVADSVVNTELKTFDVDVDTQQPNGDKFTVTERYDGGGAYNAVVEEDSAPSGDGVLVDLKDIYKDSTLLNSYDNRFSNHMDDSPVQDTSVATETVNITVTGLAEEFDLQGAVLVSGEGANRIFTFRLDELQDGNVKVVVPKHYSGEVDFKLQYVTTENDGDSKTSVFDDVKVLVTPKAEDTPAIELNTLEVREDTLTPIAFNLTNPAVDDNGNQETLYELWIKKSDVENKEFTLFTDTSYTKLADSVDGNDISMETIGGEEYYHLQNGAFNNLYVQYDPDLGASTDLSFEVKYTFMDYIDTDGKRLENISPQETTTYTMNLSPITDDIDAQGTSIDDNNSNNDIADVDLDGNDDGVQDDMSFQILSDSQVTVKIHIDGVDMPDEVDPATGNKPNGVDDDASEQIQSIRIDGVPKGIGIEGGRYAGDIEDPDNPGVYTGIWYIDNPKDPDGNALSIDSDGADYNLVLNILSPYAYGTDEYTGHEVGGTIEVSFVNVDGGAAAVRDVVKISIDDTQYNPSANPEVPIDILEWNSDGKSDVIVEDTPTKLGDLINFAIDDSKVGNHSDTTYNGVSGIADGEDVTYKRFSITVEGLENATVEGNGWIEDTSNGTVFWTYQGAEGETDIQAALDKLIVTPNLNYNKNHDPAQGDTQGVFNDGPLKFTATLTTYTQSGFSDDASLDYVGNVQPVTDDFTLDTTFDFVDEDGAASVTANEDGTFNIDIAIDSVDNPYLSVQSDYTITNNSPDNKGVIVADGSDEKLDGQISWDNGATWHDLNVGDSITVPKESINDVVFKLNQDIAGHVKLDYSVDVLENGDTGSAKTVTNAVEFDVNPVADGLAGANGVKIVGDEDTYIELTDSEGNSFDTLDSNDPTEEVSSLVLSGVPVGYLVYVGEDGSQVLADNLGIDGSGNNSWAIDVAGGVPKIWLRAPEDVGGVSSTPTAGWELLDSIKLVTGVNDMGSTIFSTQDVQLQINAVADDLTSISAEDIRGVEGDDIDFIFNALVKDTDGSEELQVTLKGLGDFAVFKLDGVELDASVVSYDDATDTYTIDSPDIDYNTIKKLSVMQNDFSGTIDVGLNTVEKSNGDTSAVKTDTFTLTISQQPHSNGDDILLFDLKGNDGGLGDDTLVFGTDWNSVGIDFTLLDDTLTKNVEVLDLTKHGDHTITLGSTDVDAMTDSTNDLTIESDAGDVVIIENDGDNVWAQRGSTNVYEDINGSTLTINGAGTIDDSALNATAGDDVLGYNGTTAIDGGEGDDRVIIFDGVSVDFSKLSNIETIDLSVKGDHDLGTLSLEDVLNVTDSNNTLVIEGNDANDKVSFATSDGWVQGSSSGGYTSYTNTNDPSVLVKVNDSIDDQIV